MLLGLSLIFALLPLYVVSTTPVAYLMFTTSNGVYRIDLDGTGLTTLVTIDPGGRDVDYHYQENKLFWGHATAGSAGKANLAGAGNTNVSPLRSELAVDWVQNKIYYSTPNTLKVYDGGTNSLVPVPSGSPGTYYDLSMYPAQNKLYSVDGSSSQLYEYDVVAESDQTFPLACPARYISHIEDGKLFYSCLSEGVYRFNLVTFNSVLIYDDANSPPFGDVTSYMNDNKVFWARKKCIFAKPVGGGAVINLPCMGDIIKGLTVVHPSVQP